MLAYCLNDPINRIDAFGLASIIPLPTIKDYYHMHKAVQYDVAEQYGFGIEVYVVGPKGIGRLDLYDGETNQYYEVKHIIAATGTLLTEQLAKYDVSHVAGWRFSEYSAMGTVSKGQAFIMGKTTYSYWDIVYHSSGDGVIAYNWHVNDKRYAQHVACAAAVCTTALVGVALGQGGGSSHLVNPIAFDSCRVY